VEFTGSVSDENLVAYYQAAKVYCQLSYYESYGMAPAEAMLCECIPVVTHRGALPEVTGDVGFFVQYGDIEGTATAIKQALQSQNGKQARNRIIEKFSHQMREEQLVSIIEEMEKKNEGT
jgi:glycosyltransferase involved in cell wall biosynthesis